ncbi:hypothetical protein C5167_025093 [Papaver somniferum]|uniref:Homeobox domain-containing protein n=1 Tax=Papaver somniferum TaxID=3469 RepID=A0A4Y7JQH4_PAPSO|nr:hypothetical protein C5167_025093 [Papaver somniferum]
MTPNIVPSGDSVRESKMSGKKFLEREGLESYLEDDKAKLVEEIGLQLKQINNWFINQRKRNWHSNSQSITSLKSKRKSLVRRGTVRKVDSGK